MLWDLSRTSVPYPKQPLCMVHGGFDLVSGLLDLQNGSFILYELYVHSRLKKLL